MEDINIKLIEKIKKLLSLSESNNENESKVAMIKAQELLIKHKLSMKEVTDFKISNNKIEDKKTNISFTKAKWKGTLAGIIAENFGCYNYFKTRRVHKIVFFGKEEDVVVCNIVLEYAIECIETNIRSIRRNYAKNGISTAGVSNDYAIGFIIGLGEKFEEQKKENTEWALVLVKDKDVVEAFNEKVFSGSLDINPDFKGHTDIYNKGLREGKNFSISDKIAEGDNEQILAIE